MLSLGSRGKGGEVHKGIRVSCQNSAGSLGAVKSTVQFGRPASIAIGSVGKFPFCYGVPRKRSRSPCICLVKQCCSFRALKNSTRTATPPPTAMYVRRTAAERIQKTNLFCVFFGITATGTAELAFFLKGAESAFLKSCWAIGRTFALEPPLFG